MTHLYDITNDYLLAHDGLTYSIFLLIGWVWGHEGRAGSWSDRKRQSSAARYEAWLNRKEVQP